MAGTKVSSRRLRKSVKSRRRQRGGLPNFLSMFEGRKAGNPEPGHVEEGAEGVEGVTHPAASSDLKPEGHEEGANNEGMSFSLPGFGAEKKEEDKGGVRKLLGFGGRRSRRASRRVRRRKVRRTARRVRRRSRRRSNRRK